MTHATLHPTPASKMGTAKTIRNRSPDIG